MTRKIFTDVFRKEAVHLVLTSGLSREQISDDRGAGKSTRGKWLTQHRHDDLMSGPHDDMYKELTRLHKENRTLSDLLKDVAGRPSMGKF